MAARRPWYPRARFYGDATHVNRPAPVLLPLSKVMQKLAMSATATARLRKIVGSGATERKPMLYRTRAPRGSLPLQRWALIVIFNPRPGVVAIWALPRGKRACKRLPKPAPLRRDLTTSVLVSALRGELCT